ncbi:cell envelope biogenesis protein TolA [Bradyrhizobium sp. AZCC 2289]|uniref:cell envelope biogenesis protein TolA n=1 Tax=Bradyrhizobium sp. AZCC 2289 TaxID=3117026 RepID=UPI002FF421EA
MAKKLKTYETSLGFFDLAIAAPSMKAALEAWGADSNLFHQGAAKQSEDPDVVAATMAKPGVMLKRPVGSNGPFKEHAELPTNLGNATARPSKAARKPAARKPKKTSSRPADKAAEQKAAVAYEREQRNREREQAKQESARQKERDRRQQAIDKAQAALDKAEREHADRAGAIQAEADAIEKRAQAENARWRKEKERLDAALRRARGQSS